MSDELSGLREEIHDFMTNDSAVARAIGHLQRKHPRLVLVPFGSAASGETTRVDHSAWVSDIEIGIVGGIWRRLTARRASRFLSTVLERDVDVFWVRPSRLRRGSRRNFGPAFPNLHAYNLARSQIIGALPNSARPVRQWAATDLPRSEGVILILNRVGELLASGDAGDYARAKVAMSCGDAILIARGEYRPTYAERERVLVKLLESEPDLFGVDTSAVAAMVVEAYGFKIRRPATPIAPSEEALRDAVVVTLLAIVGGGRDELPHAIRACLAASFGTRVSAIRSRIRGTYAVFRGRGQVPARAGLRLLGGEAMEISVYVALLASYLDPDRHSGSSNSLDPMSEADAVRLWRAYCY